MAFKITKTAKSQRYDYLASKVGTVRAEAYAGAHPADEPAWLKAAARLSAHPAVTSRKPVFCAVHHPTLSARVRRLGDFLSFAAEVSPALGRKIASEIKIQAVTESNRIEGSKLQRADMDRIVRSPAKADTGNQDVRAALNGLQAMETLESPSFRLTVTSVLGLYLTASEGLLGPDGLPLSRGFRTDPAVVGLSQKATAAPGEIRARLSALVKWANGPAKKLDPLEAAFRFHLDYESIHPFEDVNGRTGRMLMNWMIARAGSTPVVVHMENRTAYFGAIEDARGGRPKKYLQLMLEQAQKTYGRVVEKFGLGAYVDPAETT